MSSTRIDRSEASSPCSEAAGAEGGEMTVQEIMTQPVYTCTVDTTLASASRRLRETGCGALVVLWLGRLAGILTDRDLALAIGTIGTIREAAPVRVGEMMTRQ